MEEKLITRLSDLGYAYNPETDANLLEFTTDAVENRIKNRVNDTTVPAELQEIEMDMICGEFLKLKKSLGQLTEYNFQQIVESIKEGDTTITFQTGMSPEQKFDSLIDSMINGHKEDFVRYRKLVW